MTRFQKRKINAQLVSTARGELAQLRSELGQAYTVFNSVSDPERLDACILEISALQSKYNLMLRSYKSLSEVSK